MTITVRLTVPAVSLEQAEEKLDAVERDIRGSLAGLFCKYGVAEYRIIGEEPRPEPPYQVGIKLT